MPDTPATDRDTLAALIADSHPCTRHSTYVADAILASDWLADLLAAERAKGAAAALAPVLAALAPLDMARHDHAKWERWSVGIDGHNLAIFLGGQIGPAGWVWGMGSGVYDCDDPDDDCHIYRSEGEAQADLIVGLLNLAADLRAALDPAAATRHDHDVAARALRDAADIVDSIAAKNADQVTFRKYAVGHLRDRADTLREDR